MTLTTDQNIDNVIDFTTRKRNELFFNRVHYVEVGWARTLGAATYCIWRELITMVDRSPDAQAKYGNRNTVPFSIQRLAEHLNMTRKTLYKHIQTLWNAGLVDLIEWEASGKFGKKPLNIVVYNYPQNDTATATKPLQIVRDYDKQYKDGEYPTYIKEVSAELYAYQVDENKAPTYEAPTPDAAPEMEPINYDDLDEYYSFLHENSREAAPLLNVYADNHSNVYADNHSNVYDGEHNNIYNAMSNNSNAKLIFDNTKKETNAPYEPVSIISIDASNVLSSSSSLLDNTKNEVIDAPVCFENEEEENELVQFANALGITFNDTENLLRDVLELHDVKRVQINKIIRQAKDKGLVYATAPLIVEQLEHMALKKESGEKIYSFEKYFVNGLYDLVLNSDFYANNNLMTIASRKQAKREKEAATRPQAPVFYNWIEEREDKEEARFQEVQGLHEQAKALREAEGN